MKEVEQEEHAVHRLVIDGSPAMREGADGASAFDRALELALASAEASLARGERVGVDVVDGVLELSFWTIATAMAVTAARPSRGDCSTSTWAVTSSTAVRNSATRASSTSCLMPPPRR